MRLPPFRVLEGDQPGLEASGGVGVEVGAGAQSFDRFGLGIDRENAPAAAKQLERVSALAAAEIDGEPLAPATLALEQVECEAQCLPRPTVKGFKMRARRVPLSGFSVLAGSGT